MAQTTTSIYAENMNKWNLAFQITREHNITMTSHEKHLPDGYFQEIYTLRRQHDDGTIDKLLTHVTEQEMFEYLFSL